MPETVRKAKMIRGGLTAIKIAVMRFHLLADGRYGYVFPTSEPLGDDADDRSAHVAMSDDLAEVARDMVRGRIVFMFYRISPHPQARPQPFCSLAWA